MYNNIINIIKAKSYKINKILKTIKKLNEIFLNETIAK